MSQIGLTLANLTLGPEALGGAVAALPGFLGPIDLVELCEVDLAVEIVFHCIRIDAVAIGCHLHAAGNSPRLRRASRSTYNAFCRRMLIGIRRPTSKANGSCGRCHWREGTSKPTHITESSILRTTGFTTPRGRAQLDGCPSIHVDSNFNLPSPLIPRTPSLATGCIHAVQRLI